PLALALALAAPFAVRWLTPLPPLPRRLVPISRAQLFARMGAGAALMLAVTALADLLGPGWSGMLTVLPIPTTILTGSSHPSQGPEFAVSLLRGLGAGLHGLAAFFTILALALEPLGVAAAFALALAALSAIQLALLQRVARAATAASRAP